MDRMAVVHRSKSASSEGQQPKAAGEKPRFGVLRAYRAVLRGAAPVTTKVNETMSDHKKEAERKIQSDYYRKRLCQRFERVRSENHFPNPNEHLGFSQASGSSAEQVRLRLRQRSEFSYPEIDELSVVSSSSDEHSQKRDHLENIGERDGSPISAGNVSHEDSVSDNLFKKLQIDIPDEEIETASEEDVDSVDLVRPKAELVTADLNDDVVKEFDKIVLHEDHEVGAINTSGDEDDRANKEGIVACQ